VREESEQRAPRVPIELDLSMDPRARKVIIDGHDITKHVVSVTAWCDRCSIAKVQLELLGHTLLTSDGAIVFQEPPLQQSPYLESWEGDQ